MKNPVQLLTRDDAVFDDYRRSPSPELRPGDIATLCVQTEHDMPNICQFDYVRVEVTSVENGTYRGEVMHRPCARMIPPSRLRYGSPLAFRMQHVFVVDDKSPNVPGNVQ